METLEEPQVLLDDEFLIRWHITDDEIDFTIYAEYDGGRLDLPEKYTKEYIEELLLEEI